MKRALPLTKKTTVNFFLTSVLSFVFCFFYSSILHGQDRTVEFTTPGTTSWTVPCGVTQVSVFVWGAGGGGGGARNGVTTGGGGGGGAFAATINIPVVQGTVIPITIGAGGTGGSGNNSASGTGGNGGASSFGSPILVSANGGQGGTRGNPGSGGARGFGGTGTAVRLGGNGANGNGTGGGGGGSSATVINYFSPFGVNGINATGNPGAAFDPLGINGGNGGDGRTVSNGDGFNASNPGGGGGGAFRPGSSNWDGGLGGNGKVEIRYNGPPSGYCIPTFNSGVEPISEVIFAGINSTSAANTDYNAPYDPLPLENSFCGVGNEASVVRGATYPVSVKGNTGGNYSDRVRVFIDWNQNGVFEASENTFVGTLTNSNGNAASTPITQNITVPATAMLGKTKMRVIKSYYYWFFGWQGDPTDPCGVYDYGQAEDYVVNVSGSCQAPTSATANNTASSITVCAGTAVTLRQVGGSISSDQNWVWSKSCGGATENTNTNTDAAYSFTPTGPGSTTFYVWPIGGSCSAPSSCQSVTVNVVAVGTISTASGYNANFSACRNINNQTHAVFNIGGGATGATATGLPVGLSGNYNPGTKTLTIYGTPTDAVGTYNYTITLSGNNPCVNPTQTGTITITDKPTISYTGSPYIYCKDAAITPNIPTVNTGGLTTTYSVQGTALPAGLTLNTSNGTISGTPTVNAASANYTIRATNGCGYTDVVIQITVITGNTVFNIAPSGSQTICSSSPGVAISLSGSVSGINYQLYRDGAAVGGGVTGTGTAIAMGTYNIAGTYTIVATTSCATNMNGSFTLSVTAQPNATFAYSATSFCKSATNPIPTISGTPTTGGNFTSSTGLVFTNTATGEINLALSPIGTNHTVTYNVPAFGGCAAYSYGPIYINIVNAPDVYDVTGGGDYCSGGPGFPVGLNNSQNGVTYQLFRNGTLVTSIVSTGGILSFGNQTIAGTYTIKAIMGTCEKWMDGEAEITVKPSPSPIVISPSSATLCQGSIIPLSVSGVPPGTSAEQLYTLGSGNINMAIPDNNTTGIASLLKVAGVPAGATITRININFNISHTYDGDLRINLKGPNNNVLNIADQAGGNGDNFTNTFVATNGTVNINSASAPFTNTYLPNGALGVQGAVTVTGNNSNTGSFNGLYNGGAAGVNGNWYLSIRDVAGGDVGQLSNWTINIYYTTVSNPTSVVWSPASEIFLDPGAVNAYDNSPQTRVYVKPSPSFTNPVTATYTAANGCTATATATLTINPSPKITMVADYCSTPGKVRITATSDIPVTNWQWSGGFGAGTGSGAYTRYIEPNTAGTYYVSAVSTGNSCPATGSMSVAQELVVNGDFEAGNTGFTTGYTYKSDYYTGAPASGLWPEATYTVDYNPQFYHTDFWGTDHTTANGNGKFMMVNGSVGPLVWSQTVTVIPNTTYYFSGYAVSLNGVSPMANLQFNINGSPMPPPATTGTLPTKAANNEPGTWVKFWGQWNSGTATTANIQIIDIVSASGGNDFAIDDISFGTLSSFLNLTSATGTDAQQACVGAPITNIRYEIGGDGSNPVVTGLPAGLTTYWNGRDLLISGTPTASGLHNFNISQRVCAGAFINKAGTINVLSASESGTFAAPSLSACYNSGGTIAVTGNVGSLTWQTSTDGITWANKTPNNGSYTGATTALYYRVIAQNTAVCLKDTSLSVKLGIKNLWTGKTNDNWFTATNWSDDQVPTASATPCPDVIIPDLQATGKPYPIISSGTGTVNNLVVHNRVTPGVSLTLLNNAALQIAGAISTPDAAINANDGTIEMNGATQSISGKYFVGKNIEKLIVSGGQLNVSSTANDTLNITEKLAFGNTTADLATNDNITLKSKLDRTASVGILNTGNVLTGKFTVERVVRYYQNWNMLTIPLRENISVYNSWQEGGAPMTSNGFGTRVTGPATPAPTGFDNTSQGYSLKWWNPVLNSGNGNWDNVINTTTENVNRRQGFFLYVRGDRGYGPGSAGSITTLRGKGTIYDANNLPVFNVTAAANKTVSLANPYASAIQINKLYTANNTKMEPNIWVWDPTLWGYYGVGGYQTISGPAGSIATPGVSSIYGAGNYPNIQSGQAVFIQTKVANPIINFNENMKEDGSMLVNRGSSPETIDNIDPAQVIMLSTHLYAADDRMLDGNRVVFDNMYSDEVDFTDAEKYNNSYINFGLTRQEKTLAVEAKSSLKATDTLYYKMSGLPTGNFKLGVSVQNINAPQLQAELIDNYLHTRTSVSLTDSSFINFSTTSDAASKAANRFIMVFQPSQVVLPVTFVQVSAQRNADRSIDVQWKVANEINIISYQVERSADGRNFSGILSRDAANYDTYRQTDLSPLADDNFYRIKAIGLGGDITYSNIVKVVPEKSPALIVVSPNPVKGKQMNIRFIKQPAGEYTLQLTNNLGQEVYKGTVTVNSATMVKTISLHPSTAGGSYRLVVINKKGEKVSNEMIMVE